MPTTLRVTTRQFLRGFKSYKELLAKGKVECFVIPLDHHQELSVTLKKPKNTGENIAAQFMKLKKPIQFNRRRDIFAGFLSRSRR